MKKGRRIKEKAEAKGRVVRLKAEDIESRRRMRAVRGQLAGAEAAPEAETPPRIPIKTPSPQDIGLPADTLLFYRKALAAGVTLAPGHQIDTAQWNGKPCQARTVLIELADCPQYQNYWARAIVGQERNAVEVTVGDHVFYMDNQDGTGYAKITAGCGMWIFPHREVRPARIIQPQNADQLFNGKAYGVQP